MADLRNGKWLKRKSLLHLLFASRLFLGVDWRAILPCGSVNYEQGWNNY